MFRRLFIDHPRSVNEGYFEHMGMAASFGWTMARASAACFLHALVPGLCEKTGSNLIRQLHGRMVTNRVVKPAPAAPEEEGLIWMAANI
ncbi:DUF6356 family protein [Sandaracinobacter sp. RS1-74]|nr:DUF6356 family protein [Sandaracinobacteroides sayramensis]